MSTLIWQSEIRLYMTGENLSDKKVLSVVDAIEEELNNRMDRVCHVCSRGARRMLVESGIEGVSFKIEML